MEINVREDSRLVEVWMTNAEQRDPVLRERLEPLYQAYRGKKYLVAVFLSGRDDLGQGTSGLLCYNKRHAAELEVQREKARAAGTVV